MNGFRNLTAEETARLEATGSTAENWNGITVSDDFSTTQIAASRFGGNVRIGSGTRVIGSTVRNYRLGERVTVENVTALECRRRSAFGNGTGVATMNECGGRSVRIFDTMSLQMAYISAVYRHRPQLMAAIDRMTDEYVLTRESDTGEVGDDTQIVGARFIREVRIGRGVTIDGTSALENGTIADGAHTGVDVKAYDFIISEGAKIDNGTIIERCFVGESCIMDKGFSAAESLFFANSHCENGEAAAIFAGPYTVSHHKSSLLIAGMFSFFNAGSGSNQSNHLFKSGAVHQAVHLRGCKFSSGAYIMSPAIEAPFTMVMGHHSHHHDTRIFPYSYLIESEARSMLMPGANLASYGTVRDIAKWPQRDRRKVCRDVVSFDEFNPYVTGLMLRGLDKLNRLQEESPDEPVYTYNKTFIKTQHLARGIKLYNKAVVAALGAMLEGGGDNPACDGRGEWTDLGGQFISRRVLSEILDDIESGRITAFAEADRRFHDFAGRYADYARSWAADVLASITGHELSAAEVDEAIEAGRNVRAALKEMTDADCRRDCSLDMAVGYGLGGDSEDDTREDYYSVRGLK